MTMWVSVPVTVPQTVIRTVSITVRRIVATDDPPPSVYRLRTVRPLPLANRGQP